MSALNVELTPLASFLPCRVRQGTARAVRRSPRVVNSVRHAPTRREDREDHKLQALVYDILPSTIAVFSYDTGPRKLSANEQFFVGAQTVVSLLQTTQIISDVCFITDHLAYASSNKTKII